MSNLHWQHVVTSRNKFFFLNIEQSPTYFRYEPLYQVGKKIGQKSLQWRYMDIYTHFLNILTTCSGVGTVIGVYFIVPDQNCNIKS